MPLSSIDPLIQQTTDKHITRANYATLREQCIQLIPVAAVVAELNDGLTQILEADRKSSAAQLTRKACQAQIQEDSIEATRDSQQAEEDVLLASQLREHLDNTEIERRLNVLGMGSDQDLILSIQSRIHILDEQIARASKEHHHAHKETEGPIHSHPIPNTQSTLTHHHDSHQQNTHPHNHHAQAQSSHQHSHGEPISEQQREFQLIKLGQAQQGLRKREAKQIELIRSLEQMNSELLVTLPEKERQRSDRAMHRHTRQQARLVDDPELLQLSHTNRMTLKRSLAESYTALQRKKRELMGRVTDTSYQVYLNRLEALLQTQPILVFQEKEALKQIIKFMQEYIATKEKEQTERTTRHEANRAKEILQNELQQKESKLSHLKKSNPQLELQNQDLAKQNQALEKTIEERGEYRNKLLKIGALGAFLTGAAVGGAFLAMHLLPLMITLIPVFFVPAAVAGLVTVGILIATLVYTIQNNQDEAQLSQNSSLIESNRTTVSSQDGEINKLEKITLPSLRRRISESEQNIAAIDQRIVRIQHHAALVFGKAKNVTVANASNQPYFGEQPPAYQFASTDQHVLTDQSGLAGPSAPPQDEHDEPEKVEQETLSC